MLGLLVLAATIYSAQSAPVGPNYDNIQYLHNFTLTYANNSLDGLGAIDNFTDVNSQMAQSLKSAINLALPGYLSSSRSSTPSSSSASASGSSSSASASSEMPSSSTTMPSSSQTTAMPGRKRRQAATSSQIITATPATATPATASPLGGSFPSSTTPSSGQPSTTQPYGTDEEFYARTDLVHFHVDINDLEGSGAI